MANDYDTYYATEDLFGEPYPELLRFMSGLHHRGRVLDVGCGQGRDALALARLGFEVTGIDHSEVGIRQMEAVAQRESLPVKGEVADIYAITDFSGYDVLLFDSMFHFYAKDAKRETALLQTALRTANQGCSIVICMHDAKRTRSALDAALTGERFTERRSDECFDYTFVDRTSGHTSTTPYRMAVVVK